MSSTTTPARQQWWSNTARDLTGLPVGAVSIQRGGSTRLERHRSLTGKHEAVAVLIDRFDLDEHSSSDAGRWILTQQATVLAVPKPRMERWGKRLQSLMALVAVAAAYLAFVQSGPWQWAAAVVAALSAVGSGWLWREIRRQDVIDVVAADLEATAQWGLDVALEALESRPPLYRSRLHAMVEARNPISIPNRVARLRGSAQ